MLLYYPGKSLPLPFPVRATGIWTDIAQAPSKFDFRRLGEVWYLVLEMFILSILVLFQLSRNIFS